MATGFQRFNFEIALVFFVLFKASIGQTYNISGSSSYAVIGGSYRLTCNIVGDNVPGRLKFTRDNVNYCVILKSSCSANNANCGCVNNNNRTLFLIIPDVKTTDEGRWRCKTVGGNVKSNTITLPVYYGPENIRLDPVGSNIIVREGTSKTVTCSADCKPSCSFSWLKRGTSVSSVGNQLTLNNRNQAGIYTCKVQHLNITNNKINSRVFTVTVYYGPDSVILDPPSIGDVVEGDDMTPVTCSADCKPNCNINWSFGGSSIPTINGVLQLTNMNRTQQGTYTCHIQNSQIKDLNKSKTLRVTVNYPPKQIAKESGNPSPIWIVVGSVLGVIFGVFFGLLCALLYKKRPNCNQSNKNPVRVSLTYDRVGPGIANINTSVDVNQSTDFGRPSTHGEYVNGNQHGNPDENPATNYEHLTAGYYNENSYQALY